MIRDRAGKKPLYYALSQGRLFFGSEIKALLAVAPDLARINPQALIQYFAVGYIPDPDTGFEPIAKLSPGYTLEYCKGEVRLRQYWDLPAYNTFEPESEEHCLVELERRLAEINDRREALGLPVLALPDTRGWYKPGHDGDENGRMPF